MSITDLSLPLRFQLRTAPCVPHGERQVEFKEDEDAPDDVLIQDDCVDKDALLDELLHGFDSPTMVGLPRRPGISVEYRRSNVFHSISAMGPMH